MNIINAILERIMPFRKVRRHFKNTELRRTELFNDLMNIDINGSEGDEYDESVNRMLIDEELADAERASNELYQKILEKG
jgi:hypothetical protein